MTRAAEILEAEKNDFARLMTTEMGKPIKGAVGEAEKCAWVCRYYAETAEPASGRSNRRDKREKQLRQFSTAWPCARSDAVELSLLAGFSFCRAGTDGRQCRLAQTRFKRAAVCARD